MANYKNLGQLNPTAATPSTLYTATTQVIISSASVCNRSATPTTFRIAHRVAGAALSDEMYIFYDSAIGANETAFFTIGACLQNTDILTVYATLGTLSFNAWGVESP